MYLGLGIWIATRVLQNIQTLAFMQIVIIGTVVLVVAWFLRSRRAASDPEPEGPPAPSTDERIASARIRIEGMEAQCTGRLEQLQGIAETQRADLRSNEDADAKEITQLNLDRTESQIAEWSSHGKNLARLSAAFLEGIKDPSNPRLEKVLGPLADLEDLPGSTAEIQRISEQLDPTGSDMDPPRE